MEYEFDKEIDSLLRQARAETVVSEQFNAHLDADEISLFAENALTNKARMRATEHLADCAKCRKILSNVVALNSEVSSENVHTAEPKAVVETAIPWYRRLFVFPQLAYTMGGLTVLLAGMIGYVTLQSYNDSKTSSVAQLETVERSRSAGGADSDGQTVTVETYSSNMTNAALASDNSASPANAAANVASKPNPPAATANSNAAAPVSKEQPVIAQAEPTSTPNNLTEQERDAENKPSNAGTTYSAETADRAGSQPNYQRNSVTRNQTIIPDSRSVQSRQMQNLPMTSPAPMSVLQAPVTKDDNDAPKRAEKKEAADKAKSVSGKDFVYKDNVWYDKAYKQQKTTNISRNSDEYKKLNSGLRSVADNLGGTVVIVWKGTAYRIQ